MKLVHLGFMVSAALMWSIPAHAAKADLPEYRIVIHNHTFEPSYIKIPAQNKVILIVENLDDSREEFESDSLQQEKIIRPKHRKKIYIGPLIPGEYSFFGDLHPNTAQGVIVAE